MKKRKKEKIVKKKVLNSKGLVICQLYKDYVKVSTPEVKEAIKEKIERCLDLPESLFLASFNEFHDYICKVDESDYKMLSNEEYLEYFHNFLDRMGISFDLKLVGNKISVQCFIGQSKCQLLEDFRLEDCDNDVLSNHVELAARKTFYNFFEAIENVNPWHEDIDISLSKGYFKSNYLETDVEWIGVDVTITFPAENLRYDHFFKKMAKFIYEMPKVID